ncbi:hypothetical protein BDZ89DRAFT_385357 [Hymenopellis radicata]|nr:hypothetical protein BDZ89DRAFT_385357 [Hymenopellis radicata]
MSLFFYCAPLATTWTILIRLSPLDQATGRPSGPGCELGRYVPLRPWARGRTTYSNNFSRHCHATPPTSMETMLC